MMEGYSDKEIFSKGKYYVIPLTFGRARIVHRTDLEGY